MFSQTYGLTVVLRFVIQFVLTPVVIAAVMMTCWAAGSFGASLVDGVGESTLAMVCSVIAELIKIGMPFLIWYLWYRAPIFAWVGVAVFVACVVWSFVCSMGWAFSLPGASEARTIEELNALYAGQAPLFWALVMLIFQVSSCVLPLMIHVSSISMTEHPQQHPHEMVRVLPPQPAPAALPAPDAVAQPDQQMPDLVTGMRGWVGEKISVDPQGVIDINMAWANYNTWAASQGMPQADPVEFERRIGQIAVGNGGGVHQGQAFGISLVQDASEFFKAG